MKWGWSIICVLIGAVDVSLLVAAIGGLIAGAFCSVFLGLSIGTLIRRRDASL